MQRYLEEITKTQQKPKTLNLQKYGPRKRIPNQNKETLQYPKIPSTPRIQYQK
jgi:hypothetical protein